MKVRTPSHGSIASYSTGFILSIALTLTAYFIVASKGLSNGWIIFTLIELAIVQLWVQVFFFLHLGRDAKARWNLLAFALMGLVVLILALGSLWIMNSLDYAHDHSGNRLPSPKATDDYILHDEGVR